MAITNYSNLQSEIANWLARTDLTGVIPDFIRLAEADFRRDLRIEESIQDSDITIDAQEVALPTDYGGAKVFVLATAPVTPLKFLPVQQLYQDWAGCASGKPLYYSIKGNHFIFSPAPDTSYTGKLSYFRKIESLSNTHSTNWLLTHHPDIYLANTLYYGFSYIRNSSEAEKWRTLYLNGRDSLVDENFHDRWFGSPVTTVVS